MEQYIFKTTDITEWQKWLNQWRHEYTIEILKIVHDSPDQVSIYLIRTSK